jgi:hypothetical protein
MLVYRVSGFSESAGPGEPGHPDFLFGSQSMGRLDNPESYSVWYVSLTESGAVGETFASHPTWSDVMLDFKYIDGSRYALHTYSIDDSCPLMDLDDSKVLLERGMRPTHVVTLNRTVTQAWALQIWNETGSRGKKWVGVRWWSRHHTEWPILGLWGVRPLWIDTEDLSIKHKSVVDAARVLNRNTV